MFCIWVIFFPGFCSVNNFEIFKKKKRKKKNCWRWWQDPILGPLNYESRILPLSYRNQLWIPHLTAELPKPTVIFIDIKYVLIYKIWCLGPYDLWPMQSHNSHFNLKNLTKCIIKVVNISNEFRHNIMNLGNQNSKYLWRIRDLKNPQTGTHFANSVLMYKILPFLCM